MEYQKITVEQKINDLSLKIVGVKHTLENYNRYESFFEKEVKIADHLFIEDCSIENGQHDGYFYSNILNLANPNKPVYVTEDAELWQVGAEVIQATAGWLTVISGIKHPRRRLLKLAAGFFMLKGAFSGFPSDYYLDEDLVIDDAISYSHIGDFRNLISAVNLEKIVKENNLKGNGLFLIGEMHVKGISAYLRNPSLRKKKILYYPQEYFSNTKARKYEKIGEKWELTEEF